MCRLLAYSGNIQNKDFLNALEQFSKLAKDGCVPCGIEPGHLDGWGIHTSNEKEEVYFRSIDPITTDKITNVIDPMTHTHGQTIAHLRKATVGKNTISNTHPFLRSGITFCHNGSIHVFPKTSFTEDRYLREGHTDSETFFLRILDRVSGQIGDATLENIQEALRQEIEEIKMNSEWTSLTCLIKTKDGILLNYAHNEEHPDVSKLKLNDYYTMYIGKKGDTTILCSETLDLDDFTWEKLANNTVLAIPYMQ